MTDYSVEVQKTDLANTRLVPLVDRSTVSLGDQQVLLQIDKFALTANNITYGVAGDMIGYWQFFPAEEGWGRIPVWGIATVLNSEAEGIEPGQRYYGYFPMSSYLVVDAGRVNARGFVDAVEHRASLPPVYNQYSRVTPENGYPAGFDNHQMIYRPLFTTSFVIDDFLFDNDFFGAKTVILSSASSKTAFGTAYQFKQRDGLNVIGLTSPGNKAFVEAMGLYDSVIGYDEISTLDSSEPVVFVDMAGNRSVLEQLHQHYKDNMACSCGVGITHWEDRDGAAPANLPGAKPTMFFAPSQIQKRTQEWGAEAFQGRLAEAWNRFLGDVDDWVNINERVGEEDMIATYLQVLRGASPDQSYVVAP